MLSDFKCTAVPNRQDYADGKKSVAALVGGERNEQGEHGSFRAVKLLGDIYCHGGCLSIHLSDL